MSAPFDQSLQDPSAFWMIFNKENSHLWITKVPKLIPPPHTRAYRADKLSEQDGCQGASGFGKTRESDFFLDKIDIRAESRRRTLRYIPCLLDTAKFGSAAKIHVHRSFFLLLHPW